MKHVPATIRPQYDGCGVDSGLWILYPNDEDHYFDAIYENLTLRLSGNMLIVGQYPDWDNESYDDYGCIDSEHVHLGELVCPNPFQDDDAATRLYEWIKHTDAVSV